MELRSLSLERYKGYAERAELELAPLTILVGPNDSGKSALAQAIQLLAGGLAPPEETVGEPLPLRSSGVRHGNSFEDLIAGRVPHGWIRLGIELSGNGSDLSLVARIQNVVAPDQTSERQIREWRLKNGTEETRAERLSLEKTSGYRVSRPGQAAEIQPIVWRGLLPAERHSLSSSVGAASERLRKWAGGVRYLRCPRALLRSPFHADGYTPSGLGPDGRNAPLALASDGELKDAVRKWYRDAFGVSLEVRMQGPYAELVIREPARGPDVQLAQSGAGLSQALPVVVTALTAEAQGPGVDVIEHPEAELHPGAHARIAELLLTRLPGPERPVIVETHSEMMLLRARRRIAEGRLAPDRVLVYWITREPSRGSTLRKIRITEAGEMESWPDDVFIEDYEEILAIRRAARTRA